MLKTPKFTRKKENFICLHCHNRIRGSGYTNHCSKCLWSRHVDNNPGDRLNDCHGPMKPIDVESKNGGYVIVHQCQKCGTIKKIKTVPEDDFENILKIVKAKK